MRLVSNDRLFVIDSRSPKKFGSFFTICDCFDWAFWKLQSKPWWGLTKIIKKSSNVQSFPDFKAVEQSMFKYLSFETNPSIVAQLV